MEDMKCESCGGVMKKENDHTLKCESCGATMEIKPETGEEAK